MFGEDRLTGEYQIDAAGFMSLPLAGAVKAAGLSKQQMEQALAKEFSSEYLRNPKVTVDVSSYRPFCITGEFAKPGEHPHKDGLNIMSAIALAGGATYRSQQSTVQIQHVGESAFRDYPMSPTIPVLPGDLVRLPQRYFSVRCSARRRQQGRDRGGAQIFAAPSNAQVPFLWSRAGILADASTCGATVKTGRPKFEM